MGFSAGAPAAEPCAAEQGGEARHVPPASSAAQQSAVEPQAAQSSTAQQAAAAMSALAAAGESARSAFPKGDVQAGAAASRFDSRGAGHSAPMSEGSAFAPEAADSHPAATTRASWHPVAERSAADGDVPPPPVPGLAATAQGASPEQQPRSAFPKGAALGAGRFAQPASPSVSTPPLGQATAGASARSAFPQGQVPGGVAAARAATPPAAGAGMASSVAGHPAAGTPTPDANAPRSAFPRGGLGGVASPASPATSPDRAPRIDRGDQGIRPMYADDELDQQARGRQDPRISPDTF